MTRVFRGLVLLGVLMVLALALPLVVVAEPYAYAEGIHVAFNEGHHQSIDAEIHATKWVEGNWRQSEIHIRFDYAYVDGERHIDQTVTLAGDSDWLEVSKDLGWGGLDGIVWVQQRRIDCWFNQSGSRVCGAEYVETVPVEIHLSLWANRRFTYSNGYFVRPSMVKGSVKIADWLIVMSMQQGIFASGYNFTDQYPG